MKKKELLWSDFHSNIHPKQINDLENWYDFAKEMLDFWGVAYYPFLHRKSKHGLPLEDTIPVEDMQKDWEYIRKFAEEKSEDDFTFFMGYEWQGNGEDGDHNVYYLNNDQGIHHPMTYKELLNKIPKGQAMAIPHHTGYAVGHRGKNWATHDYEYSPFTEIYSSHGSSESDYDDLPMNVHIHMGPRDSKGTVMQGLKEGAVTGIICSGDNHVCPAITGNGFLAVWSEDRSRESIFKALLNRNVYGVTRSRIQLNYELNDSLMGDFIEPSQTSKAKVEVKGTNAIDRIEFIKNNVVKDTYIHNGQWEEEILTGNVVFKFELELGWGPDQRVYPDIQEKHWTGSLKTTGKILGIEKLWTTPGQSVSMIGESEAEFDINTTKGGYGNEKLSQKNHQTPYIQNQSMIFEIEADVNSDLEITIDDKTYSCKVKDILSESHLIGLVDEAKKLAKERFDKDDFYRSDPFWHNAYKVKIHRGVPDSAYEVTYETELGELTQDDYVLVKVYQRNGERAWASPIWVKN